MQSRPRIGVAGARALIPRDPSRTRGWDYDPATNTITFYGAECATLQSGSVPGVDVDFGCPGPLI